MKSLGTCRIVLVSAHGFARRISRACSGLSPEMELQEAAFRLPRQKSEGASAGPAASKHQQQSKQLSKSKMKKLLKQEQEKERKNMVFEQFSSFYEEQYGSSRWTSLMSFLLVKPRVACLVNKYSQRLRIPPTPDSVLVPFLQLPTFETLNQFPHPERDSNNVLDYYLMDAASVLAAEALEVEEGDHILDLCAAPGGKTLAILQQLDLSKGSLTANDTSETRRRRLSKVISEYIPEDLRRSVRITRRNGIRWAEMDHYDKVLVDAPCSSERHLLHDSKELGTWTPRRTENCAKRQLALLFAALRAVKLYGRIVYSTCSLSQHENDDIITKAMEKGKLEFEVIHKDWCIGEKTEHGWIVLPDSSQGWGPIYIAVLKKICTSLDFFDEQFEELGSDDEEEQQLAIPASTYSSSEDESE